jgi:hypothetical protein
MRWSVLSLLLAASLSGCVSRTPLSALPDSKGMTLNNPSVSEGKAAIVFSTAHGRNAQIAGASGGFFGSVIGRSVAAAAAGDGEDRVIALRERNGAPEAKAIEGSLETRLKSAGMKLSGVSATHRLTISLTAVGLMEHQRGYWAPMAKVTAELLNQSDEKMWKAIAASTGTHPRKLDEFSQQPELYRNDFAEVADDLARQLIEGPIRN